MTPVGFTVAILACGSVAAAQWSVVNLTPAGAREAYVHAITTHTQYGAVGLGEGPIQPASWSGSAVGWTPYSTNPSLGGRILAVSGNVLAGYVSSKAAVWLGFPPVATDLHPSGWESRVTTIGGDRQFGWTRALATSRNMAAMWSGSAASYVNMNPSGSIESEIRAATSTRQGGYAAFAASSGRAVIWNGSANSYIGLHPAGPWTNSWINGMSETQQVGAARNFPQWPHAAIWHDTAESFTDIDPPEAYGYSELLATCGTAQVGYIAPASGVYAGIWFGTAQSFHNLAQYLPANYGYSKATCIATDGFRYYVGGYAENGFTLRNEAFLWMGAVPGACYANCDQSTAAPVLNIADFTCFLQRFSAGELYANCDLSAAAPVLNIADFTCFLQRFAQGCP
jgi:hypothetical protein